MDYSAIKDHERNYMIKVEERNRKLQELMKNSSINEK